MSAPTPVPAPGAAPEAAPGTSGELMDRIYRWQRHIYDVTRKYYLFGRDRLIADLAPPAGGTVLELGCGTARNLILAARRYPEARFFGVDISAEMLASARAAIARAGLSDRVFVAEGDATDFDPAWLFGEARFDRVFLSYSLSMIPPWRAALEAGIGVLAPDGQMHVVDFGQMNRYPGFLRAPMRAWLAAFHVSPRADLADALGEVAARAGRTAELVSLHGGYAVYGRVQAGILPG